MSEGTVSETVERTLEKSPAAAATPADQAPPRQDGEEESVLRVECRDGAGIVWFDVPGEKVNTLRAGFEEEFDRALGTLDDLAREGTIDAAVLASAKHGSFIAGADVRMLASAGSAEEVAGLSRTSQAVMADIEGFRLPIVAAVDGAALGGGLEVALACAGRVASNAGSTELGVPEVQLGLLPAGGGTQRLPRLIGIEKALQMILTGDAVEPGRAKAYGLVDEVVHPAILIDAAVERSRRLGRERGVVSKLKEAVSRATDPKRLRALLLEDNPAGRKILFGQAEKRTRSRTGGNMPAPLRALEVVRTGVEEGMQAGLRAEAEAFGDLAMTREAGNLMRVFFARNRLKKPVAARDDVPGEPREVRKVAVLGAGLMGSGIAAVTVYGADVPVRLKDVGFEPIRSGLRSVREALDDRLEKGKISEHDRDRLMAMVRPSTDYSGFGRVDLVIEAVLEDLEVKHQVLKEVEEATHRDAVFASNTSSIPITRIAEGSSRPETVVGMHYFSPVPKVPLLEVIEGEVTAPWATATAVEVGRKQGKLVIVVDDGTGFYTSRILAPFMNEAAHMLAEGFPIETVDRALSGFGFPVGPFKLLDEVGIDVAGKISEILEDDFGDRMAAAPALERLLEDDRKGRKNGRGLYRYRRVAEGEYERERDEGADPAVYDLVGVEPDEELAEAPDEELGRIARRCVLRMVDEAARCYGEGIVRSADDGDAGAVFGLGFPPFLGGPLRWVDEEGPGRVIGWLEALRAEHGDRFEPAPTLRDLAERGLGFHDDGAPEPGTA